MSCKEVSIFAVDVDELDCDSIARALRQTNINIVSSTVWEAFDHLRGVNGKAKLMFPYLVLLDPRMPRMEGIEFLVALRASHDLADTIVFVLSTTSLDEKQCFAYNLNIAGFIPKDHLGTRSLKLVEMIERFWRIADRRSRINPAIAPRPAALPPNSSGWDPLGAGPKESGEHVS